MNKEHRSNVPTLCERTEDTAPPRWKSARLAPAASEFAVLVSTSGI